MKKYVLCISLFLSLTAQGQSRPPVKNKDFSIPMSFDVIGHGVELQPLLLQYDLESSKGHQLSFGSVKIDAENFAVDVLPTNQLDPRVVKATESDSLKDSVFLFQWPENLMAEGTLEMISRTGRVLWSEKIDSRAKETWQEQLQKWKEPLLAAKSTREEINRFNIFKTQYGFRNAENRASIFWKTNEVFKFCFTYKAERGLTRLCSSLFEIAKRKNQIRLQPFPLVEIPARVIINNENRKLAESIPVPVGQPVQFYAELRSGISFEFASVPQNIHVVDMVEDRANPGWAWITTEFELPPLAPSILLNQQKTSEWIEWIGWQQTIGDFRKYWRSRIPMKNSYLLVPGLGGGVFRQNFVISRLPKEEMRPYLESRLIKGTYSDGAPIRGRKPVSVSVRTDQNSVQESEDHESFEWKFGAKLRGEMNRSYLLVGDGDNVFPASHDLYKGYNREISARLSGVMGSGSISDPRLTIIGELAFNYWFEDIFSWTNYWLARQRWGISFKNFQSLTPLKISSYEANLSSYTAELKYRLSHGLWARDETWGILGGYQKFQYDMFDASMSGIGAFWARSMPRLLDDALNILPFLNHPKWVDMELIYYLSPMDSETTLGGKGIGNWALNFHGQVMMTQQFFAEAGFGIKHYDFSQNVIQSNKTVGKSFSFTSSYATVGFGYRF